MSSKRVGKFIGATPTYGRKGSESEGSRSGSWTMDQVDTQIRNGDWSSSYHIKSGIISGISSDVAGAPSTQQVQFSSDGTKMYTISDSTDALHQHSLSTAWDISTVSYDFITFSVKNETTAPTGFHFSTNGRRIYLVSNGGPSHFNNGWDAVIQYDLSTAWDLTTASYNGRYVNINPDGNQDSQGIFVKPDETRFYVVDRQDDRIREWSMSPGNVSTAVTTGFSTNTTGVADPRDIFFSGDGQNMYLCDVQSDDLTHYRLSTPWRLDKASRQTTEYSFNSNGGGDPVGFAFKPDGTKMYHVSSNRIFQHDLTVPWYLSPAPSYTSNYYTPPYDRFGLTWKPDGTRLFMTQDVTSRVGVMALDLNTAWDVTDIDSSSYTFFNTESDDTNPRGVTFNDDGTKMYVSADQNNSIQEYNLSSAWDITSASYSQQFLYRNMITDVRECFFGDSGYKLYNICPSRDHLFQFNLSTAYDVSTAKPSGEKIAYDPDTREGSLTCGAISPDGRFVVLSGHSLAGMLQYELKEPWRLSTASPPYSLYNQFAVGAQTLDRTYASTSYGYDFNDDGTRLWAVAQSSQTIYEYRLTEAWNIKTMYFTNIARDISDYAETSPISLRWGDDGKKLYVVRSSYVHEVVEWDVPIPWDITSMVYSYSFNLSSQGTDPRDLVFKDDGTRMFVLCRSNDTVFQYNLSTAWDLSTASYSTYNFSVSSQEGDPRGIEFNADGTQFLICGNQTERVKPFDVSSAWDLSSTVGLNTNTESYYDYLRTDFDTNDGQAIRYGNNGKMLYFCTDDQYLYQIGLTTAYNSQTFRFTGIQTCRRYMREFPDNSPEGLAFGKDGKRIYIYGNQSELIYQYDL